MPISRQARMTRKAISPRLAINILRNIDTPVRLHLLRRVPILPLERLEYYIMLV
jgi:hypothetical protein